MIFRLRAAHEPNLSQIVSRLPGPEDEKEEGHSAVYADDMHGSWARPCVQGIPVEVGGRVDLHRAGIHRVRQLGQVLWI